MPAKTKRDEEKWEKAKELAKERGQAENYAYIMGIYKNMKPDYEFKSGPEAKASNQEKLESRWFFAAESAEQAYKRREREISQRLRKLDSWLKKHAKEFTDPRKGAGRDWDYVGDLGHIAESLKDLMEGF